MTRKPGAGGTRRQGPKAAPSTSGHDRPATKARLALPGDPGRSLRLLDKIRQSKRPEAKSGASDRAGAVTPGQKRLILAAQEAGLRPAAIAREFRLSRPTVQHVITAAQRARRETER